MRRRLSISNSNLKQIAAITLIAALLIITGSYIGGAYEEAASKNKVNIWNQQRFDDFYNTEYRSLDMIFFGSSHSYCTFDPECIDSLMGTNSFQLGMPLQLPDATYYTMRAAFNKQNPDIAVMELYWDVMNIDFDMKQADALFKVLENDDYRTEYFWDVFPPGEKVKYIIKPIRFQQDFLAYKNNKLLEYINNKFGLKPTITQPEGEEYYRSKGYIYCDYVMSDNDYEKLASASPIDGRKWKMSDVQQGYIEDIAKLCQSKGIKLVFVTAPISNVSLNNINYYTSINSKVSALAERLNVPYLDFNIINTNGQLFNDDHFRDGKHLNHSGVQIADEYFVQWLETLKIITASHNEGEEYNAQL